MQKRFFKFLSFILTLSILSGISSVSFTGFAEDASIDISDIESFASALTDIITEAETNLDKTKHNDEDAVAQGDEKDFEATRLIVKSDSSLDDMGAVSKAEGLLGLHIFQYKNAGTAALAYQHYLNNKNVDWVEYDKIVTASSVKPTVDERWLTVKGSKYLSWGADVMGVESFTEELSENELENVTVAVIDTGIDTDHPLFGGFYDETENPDGRILSNGANFSESKNTIPFEDDNGHGTHVSGTVVDLTLSNVKILPVKVLDDLGSGYSSSIATGILYAAYSGADVLNMSFGGAGYDTFIDDYVIDIAYDLGCVPVASAGNEFMNAEFFYPGALEKCITVGSLNEYLSVSYFSNYGNAIDVCAPGEYILSANMGGGYISFDGTSMAAPHVCALAALYLSKYPSLGADELSEMITANAVDLGEAGDDYVYGSGLAFAKSDSLRSLGTVDIDFSENSVADIDNPNTYADTFAKPTAVTLSCLGSDSMYYTLDGTDPLTSSSATLYNGSFTIDNTSRLRAVALNNSKQPGRSVPLTRDIYINGTAPSYKLITDGTEIVSAFGLLPSEYTVPSGYTTVGDYAFVNHHEIEMLSFSDSVTTVSEGGFLRCELSYLDLNRVKSIGALSFACDSIISTLTAPELVSIGNNAFAYTEMTETFDFPKVKEIGDYAFCFSTVIGLDFPEVRTIGNYAFLATAFWGFANSFHDLFSAPKTETIGDYAFYFSDIAELDLPCVTKIGKYAFAYSGLTNINVPLIESVDDYVFYGSWLEEFNMPKLKHIGDFAFAGCIFETIGEFPLVETVGDGAFYYIYAHSGLSLPKLTAAGDSTFEGAMVSHLSLPKLKTAGDYTFYAVESTDAFDLPELVSAGDYAFSESSFYAFNVPKLKTIGNCAFMYCHNLSSISLPVVENIGAMAFLGSDILSIKLPDSVKYIGTKAFNRIPEYYFDTTLIASKNSYTEQYAKENGYRFISKETTFTVTFVNAHGRTISIQQVSAGDSAVSPKAPFRLAQRFLYWDADFSCVCDDITVYPVYESVFANLWDRIIFFFLDLFGIIYY